MPTYQMSKNETEQWEQDKDVQQPSNMKTSRKKCRQLISDIAISRKCTFIHDCFGDLVYSI